MKLGHTAIAALLAIMTLSGHVATAEQPDTNPEAEPLQEVIVTARFREERLQDVGAAITAVDGELLEKYAIRDFIDVVNRTAGVDVYSRGPNKSDVSVRGASQLVAQSDFQRVSSLTAIYMDGVSVTMPFSSQRAWNMFDLERIEVLRGPQGTLYGEGAMGGAVRYVTRSPDLSELGARLNGSFSSVDGGDDLGSYFNASINIPIVTDRFGVRLTGFHRDDPGFIDYRLAGIDDANGFESSGARAVLLATLSDALTVRSTLIYEDSTAESAWTATGNVEDLTNNFHAFLEPQEDEAFLAGLQFDYVTGFGTFTSITGYLDRQIDELGLDPTATGLFGLPFSKINVLAHEAFSEELRFVSAGEGPFGVLLGAYYKDSRQDAKIINRVDLPAITGTLLDEDEVYEGEQISVFGELSYEISDRLSRTGGLRYFKEDVDASQLWNRPAVILSFIPTSTFNTTLSIEEVLPKVLVEFQATDDALLYAGAAKGARNGGLNVTSVINLIALAGVDNTPFRTYAEDSTWSYEIGAKSTSLDGRLLANAAVYLTEWEDMQLLVSTPPLPPFFPAGLGFIGNGNEARSQGVELELDYRPDERFRLFLSGTVADGEFTEDVVINQQLGLITPEGSPLPGQSGWSVNTGAEFARPIGSAGTTFTGRLNYQRRGKSRNFLTEEDPDPAVDIVPTTPEYGVLNAGLGLQGRSWSVDLFVNNLTSEIVPLYQGFSGSGFYINRPRVVGLTIEKSF